MKLVMIKIIFEILLVLNKRVFQIQVNYNISKINCRMLVVLSYILLKLKLSKVQLV